MSIYHSRVIRTLVCRTAAWGALWALGLPVMFAAGIQNVFFLGASATQAVISFDVPDPTNCLVQVSTDPNFGTFVDDTNALLFPLAQNCNRPGSTVQGHHVTFVAGTRTARLASDGLFHSLALEANRLHYYRIISQSTTMFTCDPNFDCIKTANPSFGNTSPEPSPFDPAAPYNYAWPTIRPGVDRNKPFIDPLTGISVAMFSGAGQNTVNLGMVVNGKSGLNAFDSANNGNWSTSANGAVIDSAASTNSTANQDALFIRFTPWCIAGATVSAPGTAMACPQGQSTYQDQTYFNSIDDVQVKIAASGTGSTTQMDFALSLDGVNPATDWQTQALTGSLASYTFPATGAASGGSITTPGFPSSQYGTGANATTFGYWFANQVTSRLTRPDMQPHTGTLTVTGTAIVWASGETFRMSACAVGSYITLVVSGTNTDFRITACNSPTSLTIASPPTNGTYNYIWQGFGILVRKHTGTTGNLNVDGATFSDFESTVNTMPISGLVDVCNTTTVTDSSGVVLRLCSWLQGFYHSIYAIEEVTGKGRFLGVAESNGGCFSNTCTPGVTSASNNYNSPSSSALGTVFLPGTTSWVINAPDVNRNAIIVQGTYNPSGSGSCPNNYQEITAVNCPSFPFNNNDVFINATPKVGADGHDHTPAALAVAYNTAQRALNPAIPIFDPAIWSPTSGGDPLDLVLGWVELQFFNGQDTMAWFIKLNTSAVPYTLAAMGNTYSSYGCRFCSDHGMGSLSGYEGIASQFTMPVGTTVGTGEIDLQATTNTDNHTVNVCSGITDPNFSRFNGTSNCFDLTLSGPDPCHITPGASEVAPTYGTCTWNGSFKNFSGVTVAVGDLLDDTNGSGEMFRVVVIPSTNVIRVLRAYATPAATLGQNARSSSLVAHTAPWRLRELCSGGSGNNGTQEWFNLNVDPTAQAGIPDYPMEITGHTDYWTTGVMAEPNRYRIYPSILALIGAPNSFTANEYGPFNGLTAFTAAGGWTQSHSGVSRDAANPYYTIDKNPLSSVSTPTNTLWSQPATNVTGALWRIAAAKVQNGGANWPSTIKTLPFVAWSGGYLLQDNSGPSSAIGGTSADSWKFCVVYNAGECVSGSSLGDVYLNVPQSAHNGNCGPWDFTRNLCAATIDETSGGLNQYSFGRIARNQGLNITDGTTLRSLSRIFNRYNFESVFSSGHGSFNGNWAFAHSDFYSGGLRSDLFVVKLPPLPPTDQIARNQFVQMLIPAGPTFRRGDHARVRFGYAENGPAGSFFCAYNRKETCFTNPNPTAANPYFFASDAAQTFVTCTTVCVLTIPALPGRVVYYAIDRVDGSGNVIATSDTRVGLVP